MIKLLHTSDVQLDAPFTFLGNKGTAHRKQLRDTFGKIVDLARERHYNLLVIAGDLFNDNQPTQSTVTHVSRLMGGLDIPVCILPGNHDCYDAGSIYRRVDWPSNVHVFEESPTIVKFDDLGLVVAGNPVLSSHSRANSLRGIVRLPDARWFVAIAHGSLQIPGFVEGATRPIHVEDIAATGADYIALGDWHSFGDHTQKDMPAFYSGAPEPTALSQSGAGFVASVTLSEDGVAVEPIRVGTVTVKTVELDVTGLGHQELATEIAGYGDPHLMFQITMRGLADVGARIDAEALEEELSAEFYWLSVKDESHLGLESIDPAEFPAEHVIGQYVRMLSEKIAASSDEHDRRIAEQALQLGAALLRGENVLR